MKIKPIFDLLFSKNVAFMMIRVFVLLSVILLVNDLPAQSIKRLYLGNDDHTDYMWTANEAQYDTAFVQMLDYYINYIDSTKDNPVDYQTRWNCDGSYWLKAYQKYRSPAQFEKLIAHIRTGHISSPLNLLVSCYGAQPAEAVLRGMFYAGKIERKFDLRFSLAVAMENQTLPLGLSSLWAGSGAKYSWKGVCDCGSRLSGINLSKRKHHLYHYRGMDGQGVLMKWYSHTRIGGGSRSLGGYSETRRDIVVKDAVDNIRSRLPEMEMMCDTITPGSPYPYNAIGAFGYGGDDLANFTAPEFIKIARTYSTPDKRIILSNEEDFFHDIERNYKNIPHQAVSFGNEWDLYCASMNETTAEVRRATEKLRSAEALATLVGLKKTGFAESFKTMKENAWDAYGLFWEHDWTADGPVSKKERADWQIKQQHYITSYVNGIFEESKSAMGEMIARSALPRFYVFNPLSWQRSDYADFPYDGHVPPKVFDLVLNKEVPSQLIVSDGKNILRIWAANLPPVGYKVFEIRKENSTTYKPAVHFNNGILENSYYRLHISPSGVITKMVDLRASGRQVIKEEKGRYLNDLGTVNLNEGTVSVENAGPVSLTVRAQSNDPIPHVVRITMYAGSPRIDIEDSIITNFSDVKTWAFSFALDTPTTHYEEIGAIATAKSEIRGGSYADQNARVDWQTFNHFANLEEKNYSVTISNLDCSFFQLGESSADSLWETSAQLKALAGGQIDGKRLGIEDQYGQTRFKYQFALQTHPAPFDQVASMRFAMEHQNPLIAAPVTGKNSLYPPDSYSFLTVNDPGVFLWALKPSEEGISDGVIARFWNINSTKAKPVISVSGSIKEVWRATHIETNEAKLPFISTRFTETFNTQQIKTFRIVMKKGNIL